MLQKLLKVILSITFLMLSITLIAQNLNVSLVGNLQYPEDANDIWGYVDSTTGTEYAIIGLRNGTSVVSLADPTNPIQVAYVAGAVSTWRDIKTWGNYAYVTTDAGADGLTIIDLSNLPDSITSTNWKPTLTVNNQSGTFNKAHNIWIDENGYAYISGANLGIGGVMILDVHTTPGTPIYIGTTANNYSHDCYARGDTLYTADISAGEFTIYDVADKTNPVFLGSQQTDFSFAHNVWLSDDSQVLFTTDEKANAPVGAYDVSNPSNIIELDLFKPIKTLGQGVIPHNVHVWNDYLVVSYYTDGLILVDGSRPSNLIEVGNFDTYLTSAGGFNGSWGAYPYLPSGKILVSDINSGLYVFQPNYVRACWLEGNVIDLVTGNPINNVDISIQGILADDETDIIGDYKTGTAIAGTYTVTAIAPGYVPAMATVTLSNGVLTIQDFQLVPAVPFIINGLVIDEQGNPISDATVTLESLTDTYNFISDSSGHFSVSMLNGDYKVLAGKWGFHTKLIQDTTLYTAAANLTIELQTGYRDDFALDLGWLSTGNAQTGNWERGNPLGTSSTAYGQVAPDEDIAGDIGEQCYVTGNNGLSIADDDVDNGQVQLFSPIFDITTYDEPRLSVQTWFVNIDWNGNPNDTLILKIFNGDSTIVMEAITLSDSNWIMRDYRLKDYIIPSNTMRFIIETQDLQGSGHIVEAGIDGFEIYNGQPINTNVIDKSVINIKVYPNPFTENIAIDYELQQHNAVLEVFNMVGQQMETQVLNDKKGLIQIGNDLNPGIYFVRIIQDEKVSTTQRIIKID
ncbi:MAG: choice-of-anchor B family protein [Saprospiraceae bacterium]